MMNRLLRPGLLLRSKSILPKGPTQIKLLRPPRQAAVRTLAAGTGEMARGEGSLEEQNGGRAVSSCPTRRLTFRGQAPHGLTLTRL